MPGGLGPRFALEAGFLIVLAAVAAYARLSAAEIIAVMAGGWLLTALFEAIAATRERLYARTRWERRIEEEPLAAEPEAEPEPEPKRRRSWIRRTAGPEAEGEAQPEGAAPASPRAEQEAPASEEAPAATPTVAPTPATARVQPDEPARASSAADPEPPAEVPAAASAPAEPAAPPAPAERGAPAAPAETPARAGARPEEAVGPVEEEAVGPKEEAVGPVEEAASAAAKGSADDEATGEFARPTQGPLRWFRRRQAEPSPPPPEGVLEPARPSARHVRLIRRSPTGETEQAAPSAGGDEQERKDADTAP